MNIHALVQKRVEACRKRNAIEAQCGGKAQEEPGWIALNEEVCDLTRQIDEHSHRLAREAAAGGGVRVGGGEGVQLGSDGRAIVDGIAVSVERSRRGKGPLPGNVKYSDLFAIDSANSAGFQSSGEFFASVFHAHEMHDPRLLGLSGVQAASGGQREAAPGAGGFMVPDQWAAQLLDTALENEIVRPRAQLWPMKSQTLKVPGMDDFVHTGGTLLGGVVAAWQNELDNLQLQNVKLRLIELQANKLALLINASNELLDDGVPDFSNMLDVKLRIAAGFFLDQAFLFGSGVGQPRGVINDPALITVPIVTGQTLAANPFVYANATAMFARIHPFCRQNTVWVMTSDAIPWLLSMQLVVTENGSPSGTPVGGSATPVVSQDKDGRMTLLTRPIFFSEKCSALGTPGDILLCDFSQYLIGLRQDITLMRSWHAGFTNDSTWFRLTVRLDGQGSWKAPITPENGATQSWCVALAQRS